MMDKKAPLYLKLFAIFMLVALISGCTLVNAADNSPAATQEEQQIVEPVGPLPAGLVEVDPMPGSVLGVNRAITLYFNQAMDQASVEAALEFSLDVTVDLSWEDDSTLTVTPNGGWPLGSQLALAIGAGAQSADGQAMQEEASLSYQTADYLIMVEQLPAADSLDIDPTAAIVVSFNYPVVALGADPDTLPAAFSLTPAAEGRGEWINTSTYIFYPEPGLYGGQGYNVSLNPDLRSVDGSPLKEAGFWSFDTAQPALVSYSPLPGEQQVRLDQAVELVFNQPMDTASLEDGFLVTTQDGSPVSGSITWDEDDTVMTFTPDALYERGSRYDIVIPETAVSTGGSRLSSNIGNYYFFSASDLFVLTTNPTSGGLKDYYQSVMLTFNAPLSGEDLDSLVSVEPAVDLSISVTEDVIYIYGYFEPEEEYVVTVSGNAEDIWGGRLEDDFELNFRGAPLETTFSVSTYTGGGVMFVNPANPGMSARVVNVNQVSIELGSVSLDEFIYLHGEADYDIREAYRPAQVSSSTQSLDILSNRNQQVGFALNGENGLTPGLYWVSLTPNPSPNYYTPQAFYAVVSHVQMVYKVSSGDALVWALDTRTGGPAANAPVTIYSVSGELLASGLTGADGVFHTEISRQADLYVSSYAVLYSPGDELFSLAANFWDWGISAWDLGYSADYYPAEYEYYVYTDRPIYRPGQMVQYRVIARSADNGRYQIPDVGSVLLSVRDYNGAELASYTLPLSDYGSGAGVYYLSEGAQPGYYQIVVGDEGNYSYLTFQVADYRKPEIDLQVSFSQEEVLAGAFLDAQVLAEYYFDAPASDIDAGWDLYVDDGYFYLPGYRVGPLSDWAYDPWASVYSSSLGMWTEGGVGTTDSAGGYAINLQTEEADQTQIYTLEVTMTDESGMPVSNRVRATVHPDPLYIGLKADTWVGQVDTEMDFEIFVVDWERNSAGAQPVQVTFGRVSWERTGPNMYGFYSYQKVVTPLSEAATIETSTDGKARIAFLPDQPGVYQIEARNGRAVTQLLVWVGGPGQAAWPTNDANQISLVPDAESYSVGDVAEVFIPNPFPGEARALVTVERGEVISYETLTVSGSGVTYSLPLNGESAPNVYLSASLVGETEAGSLAYYYGLTNLDVEPEEMILNVQLIGEPERAAPGEVVSFTVLVTDSDGNPVEGDFSLSLVDEAVLALADPFEDDIASFFYDRQRLSVRTSSSLLAAAENYFPDAGGLGGGGGDASSAQIRDEFKDTAYWNASIITGADGMATVDVVLPDNLTTWRVLVRGVTKDTRVGEAISELVVSKELLIRPVLPRFAVAGDYLQIGAVVHNNTDSAIQVSMAFQITGMTLEDPNSALQDFEIPANGRVEVNWWGTVEDVTQIEAIFTAEGGGYSDITTPQNGAIPVYRYLAEQTFSTAGVLAEGGERLEVVSLPATFDPTSGGLTLEMTSSLAAVALEGLEAIEAYPSESIEYTISRFLPNLEMLNALREFGLDSPELEAELGGMVEDMLTELVSAQNYDGGWGWNSYSSSAQSNPYISAYALLGLVRAEEMGYPVQDYILDRVEQYLIEFLVEVQLDLEEGWQYDRFAFIHFALTEAGTPLISSMTSVMDESDKFSPWAQALLYLAVEQADPGNQQAASMFSNLQASAIRSASGAHWDASGYGWQNMSSDTFNNAVVIYALARTDPASPLLTDAVRYLMAYRDAEGGWSNSYTTAWGLIALTEVMCGTGELGGEFGFDAELNNHVFAAGEAGGAEQFVPVVAVEDIQNMLADSPNALTISRDPGTGRLYYRANLAVAQPVDEVEPLDRGITVTREYFPGGEDCLAGECDPITGAQVGDLVTVRVTITLPNSLNYVQVEDYIPAGTEVLNTSLNTAQLGGDYAYYDVPLYDPRDPYAAGWGWWLFGDPTVYDEHVSWNAEYLPAGTYQLAYTLVVLQPGSFQVIPAQAYQVYFPDVQGTSAGDVFEVGE